MQNDTYLTTAEAAEYLKLKERKLYELVANGAIPCSKVTGKWLFPRAALDRWIDAGLLLPDGFIALAPPSIIGGSHDPLLEWAVRRSNAGLALLSEGSATGLDRLQRNEVAMAAIHLHAVDRTGSDADEAANMAAVAARPALHDAVVIAFARREQGLMVAPGNPMDLRSLADAAARGARFGLRQTGAGAQLLLQRLLLAAGLALDRLAVQSPPFATGQDLAHAVRAGDVDCGLATRAVALIQGLDFVPVAWERFDLALRRRTYFEPGPQALFVLMRTAAFRLQAERFTGYDVEEAGSVRLNR